MKQIVISYSMLLLATCNNLYAQTNAVATSTEKKTGAGSQGSAGSKTEQDIRNILTELIDANLHGDKKVFERYMADNYIETQPNGQINSKAEIIRNVQAPPASLHVKQSFEDLRVQEHGGTAVALFRGIQTFQENGQEIRQSYRITYVYMKDNGQWKMLAGQFTEIPAGKLAAKVDPAVYNSYVGQYELGPEHFLTISRDGDKLIGQVTNGKTKFEFLPESETAFYMKDDQKTRIKFVKDDKGQVIHLIHTYTNGQEVKENKVK